MIRSHDGIRFSVCDICALVVLTSGFAEGGGGAEPEVREYAEEGEYDYESDSDLDDFYSPSVKDGGQAAGPSKGRGKESLITDDTIKTGLENALFNPISQRVLEGLKRSLRMR